MYADDDNLSRQKATARLRTTLALYRNGEIGLSVLERRLPSSEIDTWQRIQQQMQSSDPAYADLCCLLAYYGHDFAANIQRLYQPYQDLARTQGTVLRRRAETLMEERLRSIPGHLTLLFERHSEPALLPLLLELRFGLRTGQMAHQSAILRLWERRRAALLHTAYLSPEYRRTVACTLITICRAANSTEAWRLIYRDLYRSVHSRDRRQMWTAYRIIADLKHTQRRLRTWDL